MFTPSSQVTARARSGCYALRTVAVAATLLGALANSVFAHPFYLVVPILKGQPSVPEPAIAVRLVGASLPTALVNRTYNESLRPYLSVTGDTGLDPTVTRWSLANGALPAGLTLDDATGDVVGTPTEATANASFTVQAHYKGQDGQAVYTIEVEGEALDVSAIALGDRHTCAITTAGALKCWGSNSNGQLGDGSNADSLAPVDVVGLSSGVVSVGAGAFFTCAVTQQGAAKCWGANSYGQLGDGTTTQQMTPTQVAGLTSGVKSITGGDNFTCAIVVGGKVMCWGYNYYGQLGAGVGPNRATLVQVSNLTSAVSVDLGASHACALTAAGAVMCWGFNTYGQLGLGSQDHQYVPVQVPGLAAGVKQVSAGENHSCSITAAGNAKCWGWNMFGQLGDSTTQTRTTPVDVSGLTESVTSIVTGGASHTCAITTAGGVKCWGGNNLYSVGDGTRTDRLVPTNVLGLTAGVSALATGGGNHTCALLNTSMKCWGANAYGQLGNGLSTNSGTPVEVQGVQ